DRKNSDNDVVQSLGISFQNALSDNTLVFSALLKDKNTQATTQAVFTATFTPVSGYRVQLFPAQTIANLDFGAQPRPAEIRGVAFNDANYNGTQDANDAGLANWTVYLDTNQNGRFDPGEPSQITNASGSYVFTGLDA